jgi:hypothetical protein
VTKTDIRTAGSPPLFSQEEIMKATRDGVKKYFIKYSEASRDPDDKVTKK